MGSLIPFSNCEIVWGTVVTAVTRGRNVILDADIPRASLPRGNAANYSTTINNNYGDDLNTPNYSTIPHSYKTPKVYEVENWTYCSVTICHRKGWERARSGESGSVGMSCRWVKFCVKVLEKKNFLFHFLKTLEVHL